MCFCHLNHCVDHSAGIRCVNRTAEQPVLASYCEWTDCILTEIIGKTAPTVDDPVGKSSAADLSPILFPVFLLPVKRKPVGILLIHVPCNGGCRGRTLPNQSRRNLKLYDHGFFCIAESFLAGWASVTLAIVFDHFTSGRNQRFFLSDNLPVPEVLSRDWIFRQ